MMEKNKMNKEQLMVAVYTTKELKSIGTTIPKEYKTRLDEPRFFVMNYNYGSLGILEDMRKIALKRDIEIC